MIGVAPWKQLHWDIRAAANFMAGGAGTGLFAATALAALAGMPLFPLAFVAMALVGLGLLAVWLEIGRPWRFINVFRNPWTSWMSREAIVAVIFMGAGFLALLLEFTGSPSAGAAMALLAALIGLGFLFCQARILFASKGIPAWREPALQPLIMATGLAEGLGLFLIACMFFAGGLDLVPVAGLVLLVILGARYFAWTRYLAALRSTGAPTGTMAALNALADPLLWAGHILPAALIAIGLIMPGLEPAAAFGGLTAFSSGWWLKYILVTRAAYNQGFAIEHSPARGKGLPGVGVKPGWVGG